MQSGLSGAEVFVRKLKSGQQQGHTPVSAYFNHFTIGQRATFNQSAAVSGVSGVSGSQGVVTGVGLRVGRPECLPGCG